MKDLSTWKACPRPARVALEGRYARLEPLNAARHGDELFEAVTLSEAADRHRYLPDPVPADRDAFQPWLDHAERSEDPLYFAVIDRKRGTVEGRQTFLRIDEANGVIETGHILWADRISRTPVTTEAFYLFASHVFDALGYRRFEWKCNNANEPSKRAALRFGMSFEGVFRQAAVVKGENRDTAWFSLLDHEWPAMKLAFNAWLDPSNFDREGQQIKRLDEFRT